MAINLRKLNERLNLAAVAAVLIYRFGFVTAPAYTTPVFLNSAFKIRQILVLICCCVILLKRVIY